jgi:osmoprotectant transport system ATP-binding protein
MFFERVSFSYGSKLILNQIDLRFEESKCYALLGPSGQGKSTLLKVLIGALFPQSGKVKGPGRFGYVIQGGALFAHLTLRQNILLQADQASVQDYEKEKRLSMLLSLTQLDPNLLEKYPHEVSGGQRQRASIIRALFLDPEMLLLDEAFTGLDWILKMEMLEQIREMLRALQKTTLFVTHDLTEAKYLADHILILDQSKIVESLPCETFFKSAQSSFGQKLLQAYSQI